MLHDGFGPKRVVGRNGRVAGLEVVKTKWVFDATGRFNPVFYENSESVIECDTVILAIGQTTKLDFLQPEDGVEVSPRGLIVADPKSLADHGARAFSPAAIAFSDRA